MTKRTKVKERENGNWLQYGAAAKSVLNKASLGSIGGQSKAYHQYKARRRSKLVFEVPAHYSSQECDVCGHTHKENRVSQPGFVCQGCGHQAHADQNAGQVIAMRGVKQLLDNQWVVKKKRTCRINRTNLKKLGNQLGQVNAEPEAASARLQSITLGETVVSRVGVKAPACSGP